LVIKDSKSIYEPGARHWLKLKKDYVHGMADSADLLVLGSYFGTGSRGGIMGSFLMGCYDEESKTYKTVCKVANGFDDETLDGLQKSLSMNKTNKEPANVPKWLDVARSLCPDFVCKDPKK
jgi:DNA ligase-3